MKKLGTLLAALMIGVSVFAADLNEVPAPVKKTILSYGTASEVTEIEEDYDEDDQTVYVVTVEKEDKIIYLTIAPSGKLISKEEESMDDDFEESED